jgi:hypothetical protein
MGARKIRDLSARLEDVRRRFEDWRRTRRGGSRIPDRLWTSAAIVASRYGISRTAHLLRVNYDALKKHVKPPTVGSAAVSEEKAAERRRPSVESARSVPAFIELAQPVPAGCYECTVELEDGGGAKMRVQLKSSTMPDLAAISRSFWNQQP